MRWYSDIGNYSRHYAPPHKVVIHFVIRKMLYYDGIILEQKITGKIVIFTLYISEDMCTFT